VVSRPTKPPARPSNEIGTFSGRPVRLIDIDAAMSPGAGSGSPCETLMIMDVKPSEVAAGVPIAVPQSATNATGDHLTPCPVRRQGEERLVRGYFAGLGGEACRRRTGLGRLTMQHASQSIFFQGRGAHSYWKPSVMLTSVQVSVSVVADQVALHVSGAQLPSTYSVVRVKSTVVPWTS